MSQYSSIKAAVNAYIKQNGRKEITGRILNAVLNATIDSLGKFYQFAGVAVPTTDPEDPDQNVCYLAGEPGTYTHFDNIVLENEEIALLFYNGTWTKQRMLIGIQEVSASVDSQTGTPSVDVSYSEGQLVLTFHNLKGDKGDTGDPAGFGSIGATVDSNIGTPGVTVVSSGPATAKELMFNFTNLKGETGVTSVIATVDNTQGTPSCTVSLVGQQLTLAFSGLKGLKGDTGVSADYPITIYNGLDSDATDQALSAYQGKVLDGKVTQLEAKVDDFTGYDVTRTYTPGPNRLNVQFDKPIRGGFIYRVTYVSCTNNAVASIRVYRREGTTTIGSYSTLSIGGSVTFNPVATNADNLLFYTSGNVATGIEIVIRVECFAKEIDGEFSIKDGTVSLAKIKPSDIDATPTESSNNLVKSGGVFSFVKSTDKKTRDEVVGAEISESFTIQASADRIQKYTPFLTDYAGKEAHLLFSLVSGDNVQSINVTFLDDDDQPIGSAISVNVGEDTILNLPENARHIQFFKLFAFTQASVYQYVLDVPGITEKMDARVTSLENRVSALEGATTLFDGKKVVCFGDSVWEFVDADGKGIIEYLQDISGNTEIYKGAIGGSRLKPRRQSVSNPTDAMAAYGNIDIYNLVNAWVNNDWANVDAAVTWLKNNTADDNTNIINNLKSCPIGDTDIVLIAGGGNDSKNGVALGTKTSNDTTTTCGSLALCIHLILSVNPKIKIFQMSPVVRYVENTNPPEEQYWSDVWQNTSGVTLADCAEALRETAKYHHIPSCDLYWGLGWNQDNFLEFFNASDLTHPYKGFRRIAEKVYSYLLAHL